MQIIIYITDGGNYMIIFLKRYISKKALIVFICVLACTLCCLPGVKTANVVMAEETDGESC